MMAANTVPLLPRLVSSSVAIANHAGKIIRDVLNKGDLQIVQKEHVKDLQTEADRAAQRCIIGSLTKHFPGLIIIGEEEESSGPVQLTEQSSVVPLKFTCPPHLAKLSQEQIVVWVDPLDGTSEFTEATAAAAHKCLMGNHDTGCGAHSTSLLDHVTVLIGIAVDGKTVAGIIHQPYFNYKNKEKELGRTIYGIIGSAGENDGVVGGLLVKPPPTGCVVATTRSHASSTVNDAVSSCDPTEVLRVGGAGHKVLLLLDGSAHAYVFASPGCKKWDTCAPQAVLEAAGGALTDIKGDHILYHRHVQHRNSEGVLATAPGQDHAAYIRKIPAHVKENLVK
uniref:3'(2'),5'-bisphosphate nucleotidase 1 n=1 Tax=Hirondellea gigas TaxID=1518452 RepID=A0A2P2IDL0_9CRUS